MYAKKYILFIVFLLIFSTCGSNDSSNEEESSIEYNEDEDDNDNFDDEDDNDNFEDEDDNDNFDDEDDNDNFDDEDENQEFCEDCLVSDGSNWLNLMQNYGNYTPPAYPKFQAPPISNTVWNQVNGPYASVIVDVEKTNGGFWAGTDGDTLSYSQIYFVDSKDLTWSIKYFIRNPLADIAVDPNNSNHAAFAVGAGWDDPSTIYLSTDSGSSWNNVTPENISAYQALAFSKSNPVKVYAAGFKEVDKVRNFFIYSSENFGATWTKSKPLPEYEMKSSAVYGIRDIGIEFIETHQTNNNILYVGTSYGLLYTEDGGNTWTNLLEDYSQQDVTSIAISESNPNLIYLRVGNNNSVECNAVDDLREEEWEDEDAQDEKVKEAVITYCPIVLQSNDGGKSWGDYGDSYKLSGDSAEGNVLNLKELILQNYLSKDKPLLYISGELISVDLDKMLLNEGYSVKRIINYKVSHNEKFAENFVKELKVNMPDMVYIYSQNSALSFLNFLNLFTLSSFSLFFFSEGFSK